MKELNQLIGILKGKVKDVQFDIDWMEKTNKEKGKKIYEDIEIFFAKGRIHGLKMAIKAVEDEILYIQQAKEINENMENMKRLLEKMHEVIDNHEEQPESDTPVA